jgi:GT2 family glycosyltransferase
VAGSRNHQPPASAGADGELAVSVVIPVHNGAAFIANAVASVLSQTMAGLEVLVVDDHSTDETAQVVAAFASRDDRVRLLRTERNGGPSVARNHGIRHARGRWIALLDADDTFLPERLAVLIRRAEEAKADLVSDNLLVLPKGGDRAEPMFPPERPVPGIVSAADFVLGNLPDYVNPRRSLGFLKPIIRRTFLQQHGLAYDETMRFAEDYKLYLNCLLAGGVWATVPSAQYIYAVSESSLTANHDCADLAKLCSVDEAALQHERALKDPLLRDALRRHLVSSQQRLHWVLFYTSLKARRLGQALSSTFTNVPVFLFITDKCFEQAGARTVSLARRWWPSRRTR